MTRPTQIVTAAARRIGSGAARRLPRRRWQRALLAGLAVTVVAGAALGITRRDRSPEATVEAFFAARAEGDCDRLVGLISEDSWPQGGRLDRDAFVEACDEAVDAYGPSLASTTALARHGDRAAVAVELGGKGQVPSRATADGLVVLDDIGGRTAHATAMLVREDGGWKVVTDHEFLRVGPSPDDTLAAYWEARVAGDCDELADMLTEDAWAADGADHRDAFVEVCRTEWSPPPPDAPAPPVPGLAFEVTEDAGDAGKHDRITAVADSPLVENPILGVETRSETITLVADGLGWRLDHEPRSIAFSVLLGLLVDRPAPGYQASSSEVILGGEDNEHGNDFDGFDGTPTERAEAGFRQGAIVAFSNAEGRRVDLVLYEFETAEGAERYAAGSTSAVLDRPDAFPASGPISCGRTDGCATAGGAVAVDVHGRYVVEAWVDDYADGAPRADTLVALAEESVAHQIEALG